VRLSGAREPVELRAARLEPVLLRGGVAFAVGVGAVEITSHLVNRLVLDRGYRHLDVDSEWNAWAWAGSTAIASAAVMALVLALVFEHHRALFALLAAWFAFLSLDDIAEVHERLGRRLGHLVGYESEDAGRLWVVLYLPAMALAAVALVTVARRLCTSNVARVIVAGLGVLAVAVAAEVVGSIARHNATASMAEIAIEEAAETVGWLLLATALAALLLSVVATAEHARDL
jgi:hypothetical protein